MNTINKINLSFGSTRIPMTTKKSVIKYLELAEPTEIKAFYNKPFEDCYKELTQTPKANIGVLLGKDRCFYIFGKTNGQDEYIYEKIKNFDKNATYVKDFKDGLPEIEPIDFSKI